MHPNKLKHQQVDFNSGVPFDFDSFMDDIKHRLIDGEIEYVSIDVSSDNPLTTINITGYPNGPDNDSVSVVHEILDQDVYNDLEPGIKPGTAEYKANFNK